ncbi:MAG: alpha/beta hydrolase [Symploca sp. SIO3C6]|uniref:Alpha/beta hydrolase n=1 Tax=Symploca sp. SIO1C4 TaxID=2607765 RepID=A0A6B3NFK8_9CYAN|nr:alpha/beta hydrolase [Symploca sp. SIO3C6]NER30457.1 alpha/beta hydrolase [Symploca sp. SIO1C4]NET06079.1 alpha/beta hydrolase [Symploca sp. SIO2B6]
MSLEVLSIPPTTDRPATGLIVLLHGWGANAQDLAAIVPALNLPDYQFLLPNAPFLHPSVWGGKMWYDLESDDYLGLEESQQLLFEWLASLEGSTGIPLSATIVGGFSQGGAMALDVGLNLTLAGLISMSGYMHQTPENIESPLPSVLIIHGRKDPVVPLSAAHRLRDYLLRLGAPMQYKEFDMEHEIKPEALEVVREFILVNFPR